MTEKFVIHKGLIDAEQEEEKDNIEEDEADEMDEGRRKKTGAIEKSLVWRLASGESPEAG